ncbi:MAG: hypothetical protein RMA76_38140 [Deltaproteobacteria bacterium]|jgi:hypothetical protein
MAEAFGYFEPAPMPLADRWDGIEHEDEEARKSFKRVDHDWIGEDADGVWIRRHPEAALLERPHLWAPVFAYGAGQIELTPEDYETLSAFEYDAKLILLAAFRRQEKRELKALGRGR